MHDQNIVLTLPAKESNEKDADAGLTASVTFTLIDVSTENALS